MRHRQWNELTRPRSCQALPALLLSVALREDDYEIDALDIRNILIESAAPCALEGDGACDRYLAGTLDAASALRGGRLHQAGLIAARFRGAAPLRRKERRKRKHPPAISNQGNVVTGGFVSCRIQILVSAGVVEPSGQSGCGTLCLRPAAVSRSRRRGEG